MRLRAEPKHPAGLPTTIIALALALASGGSGAARARRAGLRTSMQARRALSTSGATSDTVAPTASTIGPASDTAAPNATPSPLVTQALAYEHGEGVPKDPQKAAALYCEAARSGDADALFNLGWMYANGRGTDARLRHRCIAVHACRRARSRAGAKVLTLFRQGQVSLPECLRDDPAVGEAVPFDIVRAEVDPFADLPAYKQRIADVVNNVAPAYGIEPRLALAVIAVESNFDHLARSEKDARGLMQLIPETAARFKVRNAFDIRDNVRGGLSYLRWLLAYYRGDVRLTAAAYNAGEGAVDRYGGVPPYAETRDYVQRVIACSAATTIRTTRASSPHRRCSAPSPAVPRTSHDQARPSRHAGDAVRGARGGVVRIVVHRRGRDAPTCPP